MLKVWDAPVRALHWTLVACFALGWATTLEAFSAIGAWHRPVGWTALGAALLRLGWGFVAPGPHARWESFLRPPRAVLEYARRVAAGSAPRYLGHNPLGAWMAALLLACFGALAATGWLYTSDAFFGDATVETLHEAIAWTMLGLVVLHAAGAVLTGRRQRENLVTAMVHGAKRAPAPDDIA